MADAVQRLYRADVGSMGFERHSRVPHSVSAAREGSMTW